MNRKHNINDKISCIAEKEAKNSEKIVIKKVSVSNCDEPEVLFIEPYYGGSHKQLIDILLKPTKYTLVTLSAKKWHWRARCSSLIIAEMMDEITTEKTLFCSSVLNLSELLGLRPELNKLKKIVYFHENQLIYPIREIKERDVQYAYNQITTCLSADIIIFNSNFNRNTFLNNIPGIIKLLPDYKPKNFLDKIKKKSKVLYFPIELHQKISIGKNDCLTIVWPHRWEFDKAPEVFLEILLQLKSINLQFKVHILGEIFHDVPDIFNEARDKLKEEILTFGYLESKEKYYEVLASSHIAVSTAIHEFFGVSMLEAAYHGCLPLVPNDLVYPEIYPKLCLYQDKSILLNRLQEYARNLLKVEEDYNKLEIDFYKYSHKLLLPSYLDILK